MSLDLVMTESAPSTLTAHTRRLRLRTTERLQFVDLTDAVADAVRLARMRSGLVSVQTLHTTTAVIVNENEPALLEDLAAVLESLVPRGRGYQHDDFSRRPGVPPDERANGQSHCQAMLLSASQTLAVEGGRIQLGRWQRVFLVELDGGRSREVLVTVVGTGRAGASRP